MKFTVRNSFLKFICGQDKDETETVKQTQTSEVYEGGGSKNVRSDVSDQEEDEESEDCPVSISKCKGSKPNLGLYI